VCGYDAVEGDQIVKDPQDLLLEADGEPRWLAEALTEIFRRLPPVPPEAPPTAPEDVWDPGTLAKLEIDPVALSAHDYWLLPIWLRRMADLVEKRAFEGSTFVLGRP
jgi:hypothetical protein